jgi:F-box protein 11
VVVDRAVTIVGEGPRETILLEPVGGEALGFAASGASVAGLTIRPARVGNDGASWSAVAVHDTAATVEDCYLASHLGATVWVGGPSAHAVVVRCSMTGGAQNAAWVAEEGRAELRDCRVAGNRWPVAASGPHAWLAIVGCEIVDNLDGGAASMARATLVVERTTVARNAGPGLVLGEPAPASRVEDCLVEGNSEVGILVGAGRGAAIVRNRIRDNAVGLVVVDGATPRVEGNELTGNATGIGVRGEGSNPLVVANTISGGRGSGVVIDEAATGRYEGNTVEGTAGAGIWIDDHGTAPRFRGNHVSASGFAGVLVTDGAGGDFDANDLRGNVAGSWKLDEPGELRRTGNLEDAGIPPATARRDPPAPGSRLVH